MHRGALVVLSLLLGACFVATSSLAQGQSFLATNNGFCAHGAYPSTTWPEGKPEDVETWGSYCSAGDRTVGSAVSTPFAASGSLALYLSGYPDSSGISLALENLADGSKIVIRPHENPGTRWLKYCFVVPELWVGKPVRLVASDDVTALGGWLGFSRPVPVGSLWNLGEAANLLLRTASHFLLLLVPSLAFCAFAVWKGIREVVMLGVIALAGTAAPGYVVFWLWLFSPRIGHAVSFCIPILAGGVLVVLLRRIGATGRKVLRPLLLPTALIFLSSLWIVSAGLAYGGMRAPFVTAWTRFSHSLPPDNMLPFLFAEGIRYGHVPSPLLGDWLSSDRPPLQTAIALSQYPYLPQPRALGHEALSVILQSSWILALWILLTAFEIDRRAVVLVIATTLFWGFTVVNSFFVWPKLLAASYVLGLLATLFADKIAAGWRSSKLLPVLAGSLMAFAVLAHGGSAFALIGLFFTFVAAKGRVPAKAFAVVILTCGVLYLPWFLYQKFYDPPGNHLLKLQLAGIEHGDRRTLLQDIAGAYSKLTFRQWLDGRKQNASMLTNSEHDYWRNTEALFVSAASGGGTVASHSARELRVESFFYFAPNLGLLAAGPFFLLAGVRKRYRTKEWRVAVLLWIFVVFTLIPWCLLMFSPGSTSIHQGTYVAVLLAGTGSVLAFWSVSRPLAYAVSTLQILQNVLMYGVFMRDAGPADRLLEGTAHYGVMALFWAAFLVCIVTLVRMSKARLTALESREAH